MQKIVRNPSIGSPYLLLPFVTQEVRIDSFHRGWEECRLESAYLLRLLLSLIKAEPLFVQAWQDLGQQDPCHPLCFHWRIPTRVLQRVREAGDETGIVRRLRSSVGL